MASRKSPSGLNPKQERFVHEYLIDLNATQAAERAGYRHPGVQGPRLLGNVRISAAITTSRNKVAAKLEVTRERIADELAKCGFSNMLDYMRTGPDGDPFLDFSKLTRDQAAALSEVTVEDFVDGRGEDARDVKRVKFKLVDKRQALMDLAKLCGFVTDKHELTGKNGAPLFDKDCIRIVVGGSEDAA